MCSPGACTLHFTIRFVHSLVIPYSAVVVVIPLTAEAIVFFSGAADGSTDRHGHCESFSQRRWKLDVETHAGTVPLAQRLRKKRRTRSSD